jgi:hypothetical protein
LPRNKFPADYLLLELQGTAHERVPGNCLSHLAFADTENDDTGQAFLNAPATPALLPGLGYSYTTTAASGAHRKPVNGQRRREWSRSNLNIFLKRP